MSQLQIWGGLECTLNRVGDQYFDQSTKNIQAARLENFKLFKDLGITKFRTACLWEKTSAPNGWAVFDEKLSFMRDHNLTPIAGFLHHGSGPKHTSLLDPHFPELFSKYAGEFAERYPWIEEFTPINEILTTARFSCLYGHWYPHHRSDHSFLKAVFLQCRATVLAMKEIRKHTPSAQLILPEDIGRCQSTEPLEYQRDFENERRWLSYDILCGELTREHPLYHYIIHSGISEDEVHWAFDNPCPPQIIGINHYLLSNRFLDHRQELYPAIFHGGNGRHHYADVGVLDTGQAEVPSPESIIKETWDRYKIPLAMTEVHTRGHREEQVRWFFQLWRAAKISSENGVDIRAITAWSLLGSYDWNSLCTKNDYFYEPGVFSLKNASLKKTALSKVIYELAHHEATSSPLVETKGQWHSERRILFAAKYGSHSLLDNVLGPPLLMACDDLKIKKYVAKILLQRNLSHISCPSATMEKMIETHRPWAILTVEVRDGKLMFKANHTNRPKISLSALYAGPTKGNLSDCIHEIIDFILDEESGHYEFEPYGLQEKNQSPKDNNEQRKKNENKDCHRWSWLLWSSIRQRISRKRPVFSNNF